MNRHRPRSPGLRLCQMVDACALRRRLRRDLSLIGKELSRSLQKVIEAVEDRHRGRTNGRLPDLRQLQAREDASREACIEILALTQGSNDELRWTRSTHNILDLMERSSDEILTMARSVARIPPGASFPFVRDLPAMGRVARGMLERSTRAVLRPEAESARRVMASDSSLDRRRDAFAAKVRRFLAAHPESASGILPYLAISDHLERIGDHASQMAEEVIYFLGESTG